MFKFSRIVQNFYLDGEIMSHINFRHLKDEESFNFVVNVITKENEQNLRYFIKLDKKEMTKLISP